jgi:hypothetical protein
VASRIHCLLEGSTTLEGPPAGLSPESIESAYFGLTGPNGHASGQEGAPA